MPENIRTREPSFFFQPHYRMKSASFLLQLGPRIFNLATVDRAYPGWSLFRDEICLIFDILSGGGVIDKVTRVGMRYINFFQSNVFQVSNFSVLLGNTSLTDGKTFLRVQFSDDGLVTTVQVTNEGHLVTEEGTKPGSIIDLDTFCLEPAFAEKASESFPNLIEAAHRTLKKRFFAGLAEGFVASLSPQYE
ncbi:MAG: TIGR04255 family protein [Thermodesulfobacteriota bacterium]